LLRVFEDVPPIFYLSKKFPFQDSTIKKNATKVPDDKRILSPSLAFFFRNFSGLKTP